MANRREQVGQVIQLDEARKRTELRALEPQEEGPRMSVAEYKGKIFRMLDMQPQDCTFICLLRSSLNKDDSIQKVLPTVNRAAKDVGLDASDSNARVEAMEALIAFSEDLEKYHEIRTSSKDKSNQLAAALGDLVVFTHGFDDALTQRLCEAHRKVLAFDSLKDNEAENQVEMKKNKIATSTGTAASISLAIVIGVAADSLLAFGGALVPLLSIACSFYAIRKRKLESRFKERKEKLEVELKGTGDDD